MAQEIFIGRSYYSLADLMIELSLIRLACRHSLSVPLVTCPLAASRGNARRSKFLPGPVAIARDADTEAGLCGPQH